MGSPPKEAHGHKLEGARMEKHALCINGHYVHDYNLSAA
jgi:hypothetical protein